MILQRMREIAASFVPSARRATLSALCVGACLAACDDDMLRTRARATTRAAAHAVLGCAVLLGACHGRSQKPEPPWDPGDAPLAFEAARTSCFGPCVPHVTRISTKGLVSHAVNGTTYDGVLPSCAPSPELRIDAEDLGRLRQLAVRANVPERPTSYPNVIPDQASMTTVVIVGQRRYSIDHPSSLAALGADPGERFIKLSDLIALNDEIERVAKTDAWLKTCSLESK